MRPPPLYELTHHGYVHFGRTTNLAFELPLAWIVTELIDGTVSSVVITDQRRQCRYRCYGVREDASYGREHCRRYFFAAHQNGKGWLSWQELHDIAELLPGPLVPTLGIMDRASAVKLALLGFPSVAARSGRLAAGIVARLPLDLYDRELNLLWWKYRSDLETTRRYPKWFKAKWLRRYEDEVDPAIWRIGVYRIGPDGVTTEGRGDGTDPG